MPERNPRGLLNLDREQMRSFGYRIIDTLVDHFEELHKKSIGRKGRRDALEHQLREPLPQKGGDPEAILEVVRTNRAAHVHHQSSDDVI